LRGGNGRLSGVDARLPHRVRFFELCAKSGIVLVARPPDLTGPLRLHPGLRLTLLRSQIADSRPAETVRRVDGSNPATSFMPPNSPEIYVRGSRAEETFLGAYSGE
jgi:hypothetical protein